MTTWKRKDEDLNRIADRIRYMSRPKDSPSYATMDPQLHKEISSRGGKATAEKRRRPK